MKSFPMQRGNTIDRYTELSELLNDHKPEFVQALNSDEMTALNHVLDFSDYAFLVIDGKTVMVILEDVVSSIYTMDSFVSIVKDLIKDNV